MSGGTFVWDKTAGRIVAKSDSPPAFSPQPYTDACEVRSQVDGRIFTSKAGLRRHYRAAGVIEVGTETVTRAAPSVTRVSKDEIRRWLWEHRNER